MNICFQIVKKILARTQIDIIGIKPEAIANHLIEIDEENKNRIGITNLKLNKLIYITFGWFSSFMILIYLKIVLKLGNMALLSLLFIINLKI